MKKAISNIVELFAQIDLKGILSSVIHEFISSCGIVLIFIFFDDSTKIYTHEEIKNCVISIFLLLCILNVIAKVINHFVRKPAMHLAQPLAKIPSAEEIMRKKKDKRIIAVHEAGHAVMAYLKNAPSFDIDMILGRVITNYYLADPKTHRESILVTYAGTAAEELFLGHFSSGCFGSENADFESAAKSIKSYIVMTDNTVSKMMLDEELWEKSIGLSKELYAETKELLSEHQHLISALADILENTDSMSTKEVRELLDYELAHNKKGDKDANSANQEKMV